MRATTAQLYPGRDTFEFDQGQVTKNQPITVLILLSESLAMLQARIFPSFSCGILGHVTRLDQPRASEKI